MTKTALLPCGGKNSRYPAGIPKYMRPMPDMRPMLSWALDSIRHQVQRVCVAIRSDHDEAYGVANAIKSIEPMCDIAILDRETNGPADTVAWMIEKMNIFGSVIVKDCDCDHVADAKDGNVVVATWREMAVGDRSEKSWITVDNDTILTINEKSSPTDWFCCGSYQFADALEFLFHHDKIKASKNEVFCSHVISSMLSFGSTFKISKASKSTDWGDFKKFLHWKRNKSVLLIDLDGTLCEAGSPYCGKSYDLVNPIPNAAIMLQKLKDQGFYICITTARPESSKSTTESWLLKYGFVFDRIIFGLPNTSRILVNDYAYSNPYPAAVAVNTKRDTGDWIDMIF